MTCSYNGTGFTDVGIDYSTNSVGVCLSDGDNLLFVSIVNKRSLTEREAGLVEELLGYEGMYIKMVSRDPTPQVKSVGLTNWERFHMASVLAYNDCVFDAIKYAIKVKGGDVRVCLENYTGKKAATDNLIQMVEYTMDLKRRLLGLVDLESFSIVASSSWKTKLVGNGNADKFMVFGKFLTEDTELSKKLSKEPDKWYRPGTKNGKPFNEVLSPVCDLIDSYYVMRYCAENFSL
jgi:hypothetical protein